MKKIMKIIKTMLINTKNNEDGAVIVIVAVAMVVMLGMAALTIDIGMTYLNEGQLQKSIDAAVYSAGRKLPVSITDINAQNEIKNSAINYASLNGYRELTKENVTLGGVVLGYYTDIAITASQKVNLNFAPVLGIDTLEFKRSAKAKISPVVRTTGVAPLGIQKDELLARIAINDLIHVTLKYGNGGGTGPSFGALDLDGTSGGACDFRLWLSQGYFGEICVGDIMVKEFGNMAGPTYEGFTEKYGGCTHYDALTGGIGCTAERYDVNCPRIVKIVVYTLGDKGKVTVDGFAAFLLEAQSDDGYIKGSFLNMVTKGTTSGGDISEDPFYGLSNLILIE